MNAGDLGARGVGNAVTLSTWRFEVGVRLHATLKYKDTGQRKGFKLEYLT